MKINSKKGVILLKDEFGKAAYKSIMAIQKKSKEENADVSCLLGQFVGLVMVALNPTGEFSMNRFLTSLNEALDDLHGIWEETKHE